MYGTLVLAMVPGIQSGIGLNFGISLVFPQDFGFSFCNGN